METRRKLIVVSNRGPVSYRRGDGGERIEQRGQGGLVTALRPLAAHHDVTWVASAMTDEDRAVAAEAGGSVLEGTGRTGEIFRLLLVTHDPATFEHFYNRFANPTLWFLQHYLWNLVEEPVTDEREHDAWLGYRQANESFAAAVLEELGREPDAAVWFHYHLYLAPRLVRHARPDALLSHFVHIPWPGPDYWTVLPEPVRVAIHDGLLANDVVGFHTDRWRENFFVSAARILGAEVDRELGTVEHDGRRTLVTARAISVDPAEFEELADSEVVREKERGLEEIPGERLIVRVDRTDPSKNIVRGFQAFEVYLERHPEACGRVTMLALLDPSRQNIPQYAAYLEEVQSAVRSVNRRFGSDAWQPIVLEIRDDFPRSLAAYKSAALPLPGERLKVAGAVPGRKAA